MDKFSQSWNDLNDGLATYAKETLNSGPELGPASLPSFGVGDAFVFDSGRTIYVSSLNGDRVEWNGGGDYRFETTADFTGPNLDWSYTDQEDCKRTGSATIKEGSESIWPLSVAKFVRVSTKSENIDPDTGDTNSFDQWLTCKVPTTETVEVPAGTFDSFVIECTRYYNQWSMQTTKWWYAPEIGFYVKRYRKWNSNEEDEENLLTYGLAPAKLAQKQRELVFETVQIALEKINFGDTKRATQSSLTIAITPLKTVPTDKGVWCRTYRQQLSARNRTSEQIKTACRTDDGWVIEDEVADKAS